MSCSCYNPCNGTSGCINYTNATCFAGNPNGNLAGILGQICIDTFTNNIYTCTTAGSTSSAVWTFIGVLCGCSGDCNNNCINGCGCNKNGWNPGCPNPIPAPPYPPCPPPVFSPQGPLKQIIPIPITNFPQIGMLSAQAILPCVQGGVSFQCTVDQLSLIGRQYQILFYTGDPNGNVAGLLGQFCLDTSSSNVYICTTAGTISTAVWTFIQGTSSVALNLVNTVACTITDTTGRITYPHQPVFSAYADSLSQLNVTGDGTIYTVKYDVASLNVGGSFSTSTGLFTAPLTGTYIFSGTLLISNLGSAHTLYTAYLNSPTSDAIYQLCNLNPYPIITPSTLEYGISFCQIVPMGIGETIGLNCQVTGGTKTINVLAGGAPNVYKSSLAGWLLG